MPLIAVTRNGTGCDAHGDCGPWEGQKRWKQSELHKSWDWLKRAARGGYDKAVHLLNRVVREHTHSSTRLSLEHGALEALEPAIYGIGCAWQCAAQCVMKERRAEEERRLQSHS